MNTAVKGVMTTWVIWVKKDATFREMAAALREYRVRAFPVVDDGTVIGAVSEADMLTKEAWPTSLAWPAASCTTGTRPGERDYPG